MIGLVIRGFSMAKNGFSLKRTIMLILVLCWIIPVTVIFITTTYFANYKARAQMKETIINSVESAVEVTKNGLLLGVESMQLESFESEVLSAHQTYTINKDQTYFYESIVGSLAQHYRGNNTFITNMIYFLADNETIYYIGSDYNQNSLEHVNIYRDTVHPTVQKIHYDLADEVKFLSYDNNMYMIRALYDDAGQQYAVMVMEVDGTQLFRGLNSIIWLRDATVSINNVEINPAGIGVNLIVRDSQESDITYIEDGNIVRVRKDQVVGNYNVVYLVLIDSSPLRNLFSTFEKMLTPTLLSIIPLLAFAAWLFVKHFTRPLETMVAAASEIKKGHIGYQIEQQPSSKEFRHLINNFNNMSRETKEQFERSYREQIALQNERIKALQSQINPHFLNNTLDIVAWEARAANNEQISNMIDALSTMLTAAIHRDGKTNAALRKELEVVDAYLFIIEVRMGDRLKVTKEIDEELADIMIPCMILQPIVENAVEHGMKDLKEYKLIIRIFEKDEKLIFQVENEGYFSNNDKENIERLLNGDEEEISVDSEVGIKNVNFRLKLLYGEQAGLKIYRTQNSTTMAEISIPIA